MQKVSRRWFMKRTAGLAAGGAMTLAPGSFPLRATARVFDMGRGVPRLDEDVWSCRFWDGNLIVPKVQGLRLPGTEGGRLTEAQAQRFVELAMQQSGIVAARVVPSSGLVTRVGDEGFEIKGANHGEGILVLG